MNLRQKLVYGFTWLVASAFCYGYWRCRVVGRDHIPKSGGAILAPTHRSIVDILVSSVYAGRRVRALGKAELFTGTMGWYSRALGGFGVHRGQIDRAALDKVGEWLSKGELVLMFPEGTRQHGLEVTELQRGVAYLAAKHHAPIIPVGIAGSEEAMPKGAKWIKPSKVVMCVGEPLLAGDQGTVRQTSDVLTKELHQQMQFLLDQAYELRG